MAVGGCGLPGIGSAASFGPTVPVVALNPTGQLAGRGVLVLGVGSAVAEFAGFAVAKFRRIMGVGQEWNGIAALATVHGWGGAGSKIRFGPAHRDLADGRRPNQSLQQTKPPVTSLAGASAAPAVFAAEARC